MNLPKSHPHIIELEKVIRDVPDFPKEGILFKDITPLLASPRCTNLVLGMLHGAIEKMPFENFTKVDAIAGVESRGFLFGMLLANKLGVPFIPIRKAGKLPYHKVSKSYGLEYGEATVEMHSDAVTQGMYVLIHDDLLATAGTACAAADLIKMQGGSVAGFAFIIELEFLNGRKKLEQYSDNNISILKY